ncbi:MAG: glycosyltransferase family 9 protein [Actinomycetota bacterium]|nr:glycosyltransferase family 9 protein [Actinomycetota bacterium]
MRDPRTGHHSVGRGFLALTASVAPRLLILRALGLGDLLTAVPALRAIRAARPDHHIVLASHPRWAPLVALTDAVDELLPMAGLDQELKWAGRPPEVAVNLHGRGPQSHRLLARLDRGELLAFGCAAAAHDGPAWRPDEHEVRRWCRLVAQGWSCPADPGDLRLRRPALPQEPQARSAGIVVLHPGAAFPARRWPVARFAAVAGWAQARGLTVRITGSAEERDLAESVAEQSRLGPEAVLAGLTSVDQLAALISDARLVVSGDTGIAHLAFAYRTPSVTLYGPVSPALWGPPPTGPHLALWTGVASNLPFASTVDAGLLSIGSAAVIAAAAEVLAYGEADAGGTASSRTRATT